MEKMRQISSEMNNLMKKTAIELQTEDVKPLMKDLQQTIVICHKLETQAFNELSGIVH